MHSSNVYKRVACPSLSPHFFSAAKMKLHGLSLMMLVFDVALLLSSISLQLAYGKEVSCSRCDYDLVTNVADVPHGLNIDFANGNM